MNTDNASSNTDTLDTYSEQAQPVQVHAQNDSISSDPMFGFFAVGLVVNIVIIAAFFFWAYKQWGKSGKRDDPPE